MEEVRKVFFSIGNYPGLTLKATINSIICAGWKVYGEDKTHCINAWDYPAWRKNVNDDKAVVQAIYEVLKSADAVVTHNGKRFDWKFLQTRLLKHKLPPLGRIKHIDTCSVAKRHLYAFNNKLETLAAQFTDEKKMDSGSGASLWCGVANREPKAQKKMSDYCKQDVRALESVFKALKPFITDIPNYNLFTTGVAGICPNCGSTRLKSNGVRLTTTRSYRRYICSDCNTWSRTDTNDRLPRPL